MLKFLSKWLQKNNFNKEAQQIDELEKQYPPDHEFLNPSKEIEDYIQGLDDDEEYLDLTIDQDNLKTFQAILKKENFHPISTGDQNALIGSGMQGAIFQGIFENHPAVAKVIIQDGELGEVNTWDMIFDNFDQIPENAKKHLPIIYSMNQDELPNPYDPTDLIPYDIIIMEKLYPLSKQMILNMAGKNKQYLNHLLKDENYLFEISKILIKNLHKNPKFGTALGDINANQILKWIIQSNEKSPDKLADFIQNKISQQHPEISELKGPGLHHLIFHSLNIAFKPDQYGWPGDIYEHRQSGFYVDQIPETKSFFELMKFIESLGIKWDDLHANNIMADQNGNLKLIDLGRKIS